MNIKLPAAYDVSHWKEIPDFKLVDPKPLLFITKATEAHPGTGYNHTDSKFERFATGMMEINCFRGFYHFNRKQFDGVKQAQHFLNIISKIDILPTDLLILDIEEGGEQASRLWAWHETVARAYPNIRMNYSRANILNSIVMTEGEKSYFKKIWTWTAGYPFFPDLYSVCPAGYTPDQSKFGPVGLWQYSANGKVTGIQGNVDLNWISSMFQTQLGMLYIGEIMPINAIGKCKNSNNKVWVGIGGRVIGAFRDGEDVTIDQKQDEYIHVSNGALVGWSKAIWFDYSIVQPGPVPVPEPIPTPAPSDEYILHVKGDVTRKFIPE